MEETIKFLESYGKILEKIKTAEWKRDGAWDRATACGGIGSGSHGGGVSDRVGVNVAEYEKYDNEIYELNVKAIAVREEIMYLLNLMPKPYSDALLLRYINLYAMRVVAKELGYSLGHTRRILRHAEEIFKDLWEN